MKEVWKKVQVFPNLKYTFCLKQWFLRKCALQKNKMELSNGALLEKEISLGSVRNWENLSGKDGGRCSKSCRVSGCFLCGGQKDGWHWCNSSVRGEYLPLYWLNDMLSFDGRIIPLCIICTWKGISILLKGDCVVGLLCMSLYVLHTSSVCSISTGEYGGGPSMPHGASCNMSGAGRQIWRDTMKWTPSSLAWRT